MVNESVHLEVCVEELVAAHVLERITTLLAGAIRGQSAAAILDLHVRASDKTDTADAWVTISVVCLKDSVDAVTEALTPRICPDCAVKVTGKPELLQ